MKHKNNEDPEEKRPEGAERFLENECRSLFFGGRGEEQRNAQKATSWGGGGNKKGGWEKLDKNRRKEATSKIGHSTNSHSESEQRGVWKRESGGRMTHPETEKDRIKPSGGCEKNLQQGKKKETLFQIKSSYVKGRNGKRGGALSSTRVRLGRWSRSDAM